MKTTLVIEINTKDEYNDIFPEDGQSEDEFEGKENELKDFRKEYADNMHSNLVKYVKGHLTEDVLESYIEDLEELYIEGWNEADDYDISITVKNADK